MKYRALLFGNSMFNDDAGLIRLAGPPTDLSLMVGALTHPEVGLHERADVASYLDRPRNEMLDLMEAFFAAGDPDDQLLLYYSGHGIRDTENNLYLCARDSYRKRPVRTAVSDMEINAFIQDGAARRVVIVLDCCYSGSFKGGDGEEIPERLGSGRFVLSSSRRSELSEDATKPGEGSVFTRFFVEALLAADADVDADGFVTLGEVYGHLLPRLRVASTQIPQRNYDNAVGDPRIARARPRPFPLALAPTPSSASAPPPPELEVSEAEVTLKGIQLGEALPVESIDVFDKHGGTIDWAVETSDAWIALTKRDGFFEMKLDPPEVGVNRGIVIVRAVGRPGSRKIRVNVTVDEPTRKPLEAEPAALDLGAMTVGKPKRSSVRVHNAGGAVSASCDDPRVTLAVKADLVDVSVAADEPGELETEIRVAAPNGEVAVAVRAAIESGPILALDPRDGIDFGRVPRGERPARHVEVRNAGSGRLEWTCVKDSGDFFDFTTDGNKSGIDVRLGDAPAGIYHGALRVRSTAGNGTVEVRAQIVEPQPVGPPAPAPSFAPAQQPPPLVFGPGRWRIDAGMMGMTVSQLLVDLTPNGALAGTLQVVGMPMQVPVQGQWGYDPFRQQVGLNLFGPGMQEQVGIQIVGAQGPSLQGTNGAGFAYLLTRAA